MISTYWTGQNVQGSGRGQLSGRPGLLYRYLCRSNEETTSIRRRACASGRIRTGISRIRARNVIMRRHFVASAFLHHSSHNQTFEIPRSPLTRRQVSPLSGCQYLSSVLVFKFTSSDSYHTCCIFTRLQSAQTRPPPATRITLLVWNLIRIILTDPVRTAQ
jgi:hypothetical protein